MPSSNARAGKSSSKRSFRLATLAIFAALGCLIPLRASAQVSVLTQRNDISRSGVNSSETILTPANVATGFGRLFSYSVDGYVYAQPLYMPNVTITGKGVHNVIFVVTEHDSVYAFDADSNAGANALPLWQITLLDANHGAAAGATTVPSADVLTNDIVPEIGITSTPVIDANTKTIYLVGKTKESGTYFERLHALDIASGAEKLGGPVDLGGSVPGNGNGSVSGTLAFDPLWENQRAGLLLLNGIIYMGFAAHGDQGPWHGWLLAYNATTLQRTGAFCTTPNGIGSGIWMSGTGLAADVPDPVNHPFGRVFVATGNGTFDAAPPFTTTMDYGDDVINLDLTNGAFTVTDSFTPMDQDTLNQNDQDLASGGVLILPDQSTGPQHLLIEVGKSGRIYLINRDNMGGYDVNTDHVVQRVVGQVLGIFSAPTYFNNRVYFWATNDDMKAFSFTNGALSATQTASSNEFSNFPGPTTVVSANGTSNAIVWAIEADSSSSPEALLAYDATNVNNLLYSSDNLANDNPGSRIKFAVPTVANGKVYVPAQLQVSVFGLTGGQTATATPSITPAAGNFANSVQVTITDSTANSTIFFTTDGSTPTSSSTQYTAPFTLSATTTVKAIATAAGMLPSAVASATYTLEPKAATPTFSPAPGTFAASQQVTLSDTTTGASIFYTTDGSTPTTSSTPFTTAITVSATTTIKAIATAANFSTSAVASGTYTIQPPAATPTFSPAPGTYQAAQQVTLSDTTPGSSIFYTTNGTTPTTSSTKFTSAITVSATTTIKAIATAPNFSTSAVASGTYTIQTAAATPTFSPAPGTYATAQQVTLSDTTPGSSIFYTTNGTTPTTSSTKFTTAITVSATTTIKAIATASGFLTSAVGSGTYTIQTPAATPTFSPAPGTYAAAQHVTLADTTAGASIFYTTNGTTPTTSSTPYAGAITVNATTTIKAIATATNFLTSAVASGTFTIETPAATPTFSPAPGTYATAQQVTLADTTAGASIFYTTNGSTPTTSSTKYTGAITVSATTTIKAIATATNFLTSAVATGTYTIETPAATPTFNPAPGTYTAAQQVTLADTTAGASIFYTTNGSTPTTSSTKYTGAITVSSTTTIKAIATATNFLTSAVATGAYTINPPPPTIDFAGGFSALNLAMNGASTINGTRLQLTSTARSKVSTSYYATPANIQSFTTDFTFQLANGTQPSGEGITFCIQNSTPTAMGFAGGGLGFGPGTTRGRKGIPKSVAVKFDLVSNQGEGVNSTGVYTNGSAPTMPATALAGSGIDLHSGHTFAVHIVYSASQLALTITDTVTQASFTKNFNVNIPSIVGGNTAYVGFTGSTSWKTATQQILTWTYSAN